MGVEQGFMESFLKSGRVYEDDWKIGNEHCNVELFGVVIYS